jgi:hypothetical protein
MDFDCLIGCVFDPVNQCGKCESGQCKCVNIPLDQCLGGFGGGGVGAGFPVGGGFPTGGGFPAGGGFPSGGAGGMGGAGGAGGN